MMTFEENTQARLILSNDEMCLNIKLCELKLLAKYFSYLNLDVKDNLNKYIRSKLYIYDESKYDDYIDKCIKYCTKYKSMGNNKIPFTNKEYDIIKNIKDDNCRRIMFAILMYAKHCVINSIYINKEHDKEKLTFSFSTRELFRFARVSYKKKESNALLLRELETLGLVKWGFGNWCEILFYDFNDNDIKIEFSPSDSIIEYVMGFEENNKSLECQECGNWFHIKTNNKKTKLCPICSKISKKNKSIETTKKWRDKNNNI